jgi:hypothetical protein
MKNLRPYLLVCALSAASFAADATKKDAPKSADAKAPAATSIPATQAKVTAPIAVKDGILSQPAATQFPAGGKAVFDFVVPKDGDYLIYADVKAPDDDNNSFYVNVDAEPKEDPLMIWDIELTSEFAERVVNWRGTGEAGSDQFDPKVFKLTAGAHKLHLLGREPAQLKSVTIRPAK